MHHVQAMISSRRAKTTKQNYLYQKNHRIDDNPVSARKASYLNSEHQWEKLLEDRRASLGRLVTSEMEGSYTACPEAAGSKELWTGSAEESRAGHLHLLKVAELWQANRAHKAFVGWIRTRYGREGNDSHCTYPSKNKKNKNRKGKEI